MVDEALWKVCVLVCRHAEPDGRLPSYEGHVDGCRVLVVDGDEVKIRADAAEDREHPHMDFVEGANDLEAAWVRREFGDKVLLLDADLDRHDWPYVLYHEAFERRTMAKGVSYDRAHVASNAGERALRIRGREAR